MRTRHLCGSGVAAVALLCQAGATAEAARVAITQLPKPNVTTMVANGTSSYQVAVTASDDDGYDDIRCVRALFNFSESGGDSNLGRGYFAWGKTDADITQYGGTWVLADANRAVGRWGYRTDAWGGTTYLIPRYCAATTSGAAAGETGTRTITFVFSVKAAWAANPLINDADGWVADSTTNTGWLDSPFAFDVVPQSCGGNAAAPRAPVLATVTDTTLDVAIDPADSDRDWFAIRVSPPVGGFEYVQSDGSVGGFPAWRTKAEWGTATVRGLVSSTAYAVDVRAVTGDPAVCPSTWGPAASATTGVLTRTVDLHAAGIPFTRAVAGMDAQPKIWSAQRIADNLAASFNTSLRAGGDGYNWKTLTAQWNSSGRTILRTLRDARDRNSWVQILLNTRGIGTGNGSTWVYTDTTPETLAALAADWVYYCNVLLPTKRQGDALTPYEQSLLDSLLWGTEDKLLAPGEVPVPKVVYWEIGNEPEGPYPPPPLTPEDYALRYRTIVPAMRAVDPTIRVAPGIMSADNGNAWLDAILADPANPVDFISYHPYGPLYGITKNNYGGVLDPAGMNAGLNQMKKQQRDRRQKVIDRLVANGRPANTELSASEFNPSSWEGTYYYGLAQTVAHGLGVAETCFSFAELGFTSAHYWDVPNMPSTTAREIPGFKVFKALQAYMGDRLLDSYAEADLRVYVTLDTKADRLVLWLLSFSEEADRPVRVRIPAIGGVRAKRITERKLAELDGDTSLITRNDKADAYDKTDWRVADRTGETDLRDFVITAEDATLTMLLIDLARPDFDGDGDVDGVDYAVFAGCFNGTGTPVAAGCEAEDLNGDAYVDGADFSLFAACFNGSADPPACR